MDRVTVMTTPERFEHLKQAHVDAGFEITNEQTIPINGLLSFQVIIRTKDVGESEPGG